MPELKLVMDPMTYRAYKLKVKEPMSISQMRRKLQQGAYSSMQFLADVQIIGSNCILFWTGVNPGLVQSAYALMKKVFVVLRLTLRVVATTCCVICSVRGQSILWLLTSRRKPSEVLLLQLRQQRPLQHPGLQSHPRRKSLFH